MLVISGAVLIINNTLLIINSTLSTINSTLSTISNTLSTINNTLSITNSPRTSPAENHSLRSVVEEAHKETEEAQQREGDSKEDLLYPTSDEADQVADRERADEDEQENGMGLHAPPWLRALNVQDDRPRQEDSQSHSLKGSCY